MTNEARSLIEKLVRWRRALEFYADPRNYVISTEYRSVVDRDEGRRAREALKEEE